MKYQIVDLFCGAGGTSTGILNAAQELDLKIDLFPVNHWTTAINSHSLNHPNCRHICEPVENLRPCDVIPSRYLYLLAASCECTFHSNARGGGPCNEQSRSQPWQIIRWITEITVENILMENVPEFVHWGPLHRITKRPIKSRRGEFFHNFIKALRDHGYTVEWKIQNAADFGDATIRRRFILMAKRNRQPIIWPEPSHSADGRGGSHPYLTARDNVIDWSLEGKSIFNRKKPLSANTLKRIAAGLRAFGGPQAEPFLVMLRGTSETHLNGTHRSVDEPIPAVTTTGKHHYLAEPFLIPAAHSDRDGRKPRIGNLDKPLPSVLGSNAHALVIPTIKGLGKAKYYCPNCTFFSWASHRKCPRCGAGRSRPVPKTESDFRNLAFVIGQQSAAAPRSVSKPIPTVAGAGAIALVEPFIIPKHSKDKPQSVKRPLNAITTRQGQALVEPFITHSTHQGKRLPHSIKEPLPTVTGARRGEMNLIEPVIVQTDQTGSNGHCTSSIDAPIKTVVSKQNMALVEPFVVKYYGTGTAKHLRQPLDAVTTKDRFLLVQPKTGKVLAELDIRFRMLQPHELAAAHSFPKHYIFTGTKEDQTKQIGNSVPVKLAQAHARALLKSSSTKTK